MPRVSMLMNSPEEPSVDELELKVFTLNCWGLKYVSKNRRSRFEAIGEYLRDTDYDIILLQEVWCREDYETLRSITAETLPYGNYFDNGIIGTGTCILTKVQLQDAAFHEFSINGYPHKVWHGDWFGGKGLGVCQIDYRGFNIHIYVSHYHAEYDPVHDNYLGHRVIHALESASWIKLTSSSADLTIYAGDFNTDPSTVAYKLLRYITPLVDCWEEANGAEGGETSETPYNLYTSEKAKISRPDGIRIDYIMYRHGPNIDCHTVSCGLPLPRLVPGKTFPYSDHEAVTATIRLWRRKTYIHAPQFRRELSRATRLDAALAIRDAVGLIQTSTAYVKSDRSRYGCFAAFIMCLLVVTFIPSAILGTDYHLALDVGLFLPRCLLTVLVMFCILMATLFNQKELNALKSTENSLRLMIHQCETMNPTMNERITEHHIHKGGFVYEKDHEEKNEEEVRLSTGQQLPIATTK